MHIAQSTLFNISGEQYTFRVTFRQAENYPVDLYFLMDVSKTMKDFKDTLQNMSYILGQWLFLFTVGLVCLLRKFIQFNVLCCMQINDTVVQPSTVMRNLGVYCR